MSVKPRQKVIDTIRNRISDGHYSPGGRLPTELEFSAELQVARGTVRSALKELSDAGFIEIRKGVGCFAAPGKCQSRMIALLMSEAEGGYGVEHVITGIISRASESGIGVGIFYYDGTAEQFDVLLKRLRSLNISRVIYRPCITPDFALRNEPLIRKLEEESFDFVTIGVPVPQKGNSIRPYVFNDNYSAMRKMVGALAEKGFRRFGMLRSFAGVYSSEQRYKAFADELSARNIPVSPDDVKITLDVAIGEQGRSRVREWLQDGLPEVIICNHDVLAYNVLDELQQHGIRVPQNVAVTGFDDLPFSEAFGLTTVRQDFYEIGRTVAENLLTDASCRKSVKILSDKVVLRRSSEYIKNKGATLCKINNKKRRKK